MWLLCGDIEIQGPTLKISGLTLGQLTIGHHLTQGNFLQETDQSLILTSRLKAARFLIWISKTILIASTHALPILAKIHSHSRRNEFVKIFKSQFQLVSATLKLHSSQTDIRPRQWILADSALEAGMIYNIITVAQLLEVLGWDVENSGNLWQLVSAVLKVTD